MEYRSGITDRLLDKTPFTHVMNELTCNTPNKLIVQIPMEERFRIQSFECLLAAHSTHELLEIFAPRRITGDQQRILDFIDAMRCCVKRRHPEWKVQN